MPWEAIKYVGSATALIAFVVAVAAWAYEQRLRQRAKLLAEASDSRRAGIAEGILEHFAIDARTLSRDQRFQLAREQLSARMRRLYVTTAAIIVIALLAAFVVIQVLLRTS